jgi:multidrug efflux pump subunit AcrA (membrane-fusion protein)
MRKVRLFSLLTFLLLAIVLIGGGVGWKLASMEPAKEMARMEKPVAVEVSPVRAGSIRDIRRLSGSLSPSSEYLVASRITARLRELTVDIGDEVEKGQIIALLDDDELQEALLEARAELAVSRARLEETRSAVEIAQRRFERIENLFRERVASDADVDSARLDLLAREAESRKRAWGSTKRRCVRRRFVCRMRRSGRIGTRMCGGWWLGSGLLTRGRCCPRMTRSFHCSKSTV